MPVGFGEIVDACDDLDALGSVIKIEEDCLSHASEGMDAAGGFDGLVFELEVVVNQLVRGVGDFESFVEVGVEPEVFELPPLFESEFAH